MTARLDRFAAASPPEHRRELRARRAQPIHRPASGFL